MRKNDLRGDIKASLRSDILLAKLRQRWAALSNLKSPTLHRTLFAACDRRRAGRISGWKSDFIARAGS